MRMITRYFVTNSLKTFEELETEVHRCGGDIQSLALNRHENDGFVVKLSKVTFSKECNRIFETISCYDLPHAEIMELTGLR